MSNGENEAASLGDRVPDPAVRSSEPADAAPPITLAGFWDGAGRLYLTRDQSQYLEFRPEDVLSFGDLAPGQPPFLGEQATWVKLPPDADVTYVRKGPAAFTDEFDEFAPRVDALDFASTASDIRRRTRYHGSAWLC